MRAHRAASPRMRSDEGVKLEANQACCSIAAGARSTQEHQARRRRGRQAGARVNLRHITEGSKAPTEMKTSSCRTMAGRRACIRCRCGIICAMAASARSRCGTAAPARTTCACITLRWTAMESASANYWPLLPEFLQGRKAIWTAVNPHTGKRRIDEAFPDDIAREHQRHVDVDSLHERHRRGAVLGSDTYDTRWSARAYAED